MNTSRIALSWVNPIDLANRDMDPPISTVVTRTIRSVVETRSERFGLSLGDIYSESANAMAPLMIPEYQIIANDLSDSLGALQLEHK